MTSCDPAPSGSARAVAVFAGAFACEPDVAEAIRAQSRLQDYAPRQVILSGGEPDERLFVMIDGHARLHAYSTDGRLLAVEDFLPGSLFGESALTGDDPAGDEVTAIERSLAGIILAPAMVALMSRHGAVALAVSRMLVARLAALTRRLVESSTLSATGRVHAELLRLARGADGMRISPVPVNSQLALRVSSTRETVSRTISALLKRGILRREDDALVVVSPHRLEELVF